MANYKVAVFIALIAVLWKTGYSYPLACNDCQDYITSTCTNLCGDQECAINCNEELFKCWDDYCSKRKRGSVSHPWTRDPDRNDVNDDNGFYDAFEK
ncbi:hypothetical protein OS493_032664 [Desmophyllum pertusum]|uniref:Uncharacterized protein n=1 Tax=Desmophyllum pertusum TaxID=174260 RepID=A0A9W9Y8A5_9CNID|nr:hypothetical protein OS493_032664 [Desmophyllum pertusum]